MCIYDYTKENKHSWTWQKHLSFSSHHWCFTLCAFIDLSVYNLIHLPVECKQTVESRPWWSVRLRLWYLFKYANMNTHPSVLADETSASHTQQTSWMFCVYNVIKRLETETKISLKWTWVCSLICICQFGKGFFTSWVCACVRTCLCKHFWWSLYNTCMMGLMVTWSRKSFSESTRVL